MQSQRWQTMENLDEAVEAGWTARRRRCAELSSCPIFLSPTLLQKVDRDPSWKKIAQSAAGPIASLQLGTIVHRLLERWDFTRAPSTCRDYLDGLLNEELCGEPAEQQQALRDELAPLFTQFVSLPLYHDLQRAMILGREVPFHLSWTDRQQVMSGTIDLLYRLDGQVWIADYKTDSIKAEDAWARAEEYRTQADIYRAAVSRSMEIDSVSFQCIFLRPGLAVTL
jgi:ATP-dependent helicase/nuclease subunit A